MWHTKHKGHIYATVNGILHRLATNKTFADTNTKQVFHVVIKKHRLQSHIDFIYKASRKIPYVVFVFTEQRLICKLECALTPKKEVMELSQMGTVNLIYTLKGITSLGVDARVRITFLPV